MIKEKKEAQERSGFELEHVQSARDLFNWATAQKNCSFFKIDQILAGQMLLFKVRRPVRATLSMVQASDGGWQIDEFEAAENKPVPRQVYFEMAAYLNRCMERELSSDDG